MTFFDYLKNIFIVLIFLQIAPNLVESVKKQYSGYLKPHAKVGIIPIKGLLYNSSQSNKHLHTFFKDPSIKAILIKMECPGSAAGTGHTIHDEIQALKKVYPKPIIVLVENLCASGGYYIASAADYIIAPGSAMIGSIGVYIPSLFQLREFIEQYKIKYDALKAGKYKGSTDPFVNLTLDEKAQLQSVIDDTYAQFVDNIATNRNLSVQNTDQWAEGKIFSGRQALKLGLIDELGSASTAIKVIKEKALIEDDIEWIYPPQKRTLFAALTGDGGDHDGNSLFNTMVERLHSALSQQCAIRTMT